ncbi:MAG TPA: hypothetical protein VJQ55_14495, partial [Candidatus Binatia bacterium]|nr:hypothetical protein [Candidatus Binatia bacterium]
GLGRHLGGSEKFPYSECHSEAKPKNLLFSAFEKRMLRWRSAYMGVQRDRILITVGERKLMDHLWFNFILLGRIDGNPWRFLLDI